MRYANITSIPSSYIVAFFSSLISCGYQWPISRHWNLEASLGVGYDYIKYDEMRCGTCGKKLKSSHKNYFGPTKAAISLIYVIN